VRVLKIGENSSKELCGGIHVQNTKEIKNFKIIKEEGVGSGIRRIIAYTHSSLMAFEDFLVQQNLALRDFLNSSYLKSLHQLKKAILLGEQEIFKDIKEESDRGKKKMVKSETGENLENPSCFQDIIEQGNSTTTGRTLNPDKIELEKPFFKKVESENLALWKGEIEKENPFLELLEQIETELKKTKQTLIKWDFSKTSELFLSEDFKTTEKIKAFHPLAEQMIELREALNLSLPFFKGESSPTREPFTTEIEFIDKDSPIDFFKRKLTELESLKTKKENYNK